MLLFRAYPRKATSPDRHDHATPQAFHSVLFSVTASANQKVWPDCQHAGVVIIYRDGPFYSGEIARHTQMAPIIILLRAEQTRLMSGFRKPKTPGLFVCELR